MKCVTMKQPASMQGCHLGYTDTLRSVLISLSSPAGMHFFFYLHATHVISIGDPCPVVSRLCIFTFSLDAT